MTVDMTALLLSWGNFNVCGPANQQNRLTNGCGAGTNEPCLHVPPVHYTKHFPTASAVFSYWLVLMWSLRRPFTYLLYQRAVRSHSIISYCQGPSGFWSKTTFICREREWRPILTELSVFVQVSRICTDRWEYMLCFQFDHEGNNQQDAQLQTL
jgi:hypothetical protein